MTLTAVEILDKMNIHRCPECRCAIGDDWDFLDFSNKSIIVCPQCDHEIYIDDTCQTCEGLRYNDKDCPVCKGTGKTEFHIDEEKLL